MNHSADLLGQRRSRRELFGLSGNAAKVAVGVAATGTALEMLSACAPTQEAKPAGTTSAADTSGSTTGAIPPAEKLKVEQLGVATPDMLAKIDNRQTLVDAFTLEASYASSAEEVIKTLVYLDNAIVFSGTSTAEIDAEGDIEKYIAQVARYEAPALEARAGKPVENTSDIGLSVRHRFVAMRAWTMHGYDKTSKYTIKPVVSNIKVTAGSYESGSFTASYEVALQDNIAGSKMSLNDPRIKSINGKDTSTSNFTKSGDKWIIETTATTYEAAKSNG